MNKLLAILILLLAPSFADAATFTSKATGDWSATGQTTWNETGSPGAADTVTINNGHVVDYDADFTHTSTITVADGGTLRGDGARVLTLNDTTLTVSAGGAITNTGGVFEIKVSSANSQASSGVVIGEATGSRASVTGQSSTNHIKFTDGGFTRGGKCNVQRTDFSNVGTVAGVAAFTFYPSSADTFSWDDCTFDAGCGHLHNTAVLNSGAIFVVEDCVHLGTGLNLPTGLTNAAIGAGTRSVQRNWFAGSFGNVGSGGSWYDVLFKHNVILGGIHSTDTADRPWSASSGFNFVRWNDTGGGMIVKQSTSLSLPWFIHIHNTSGSVNNCRGVSLTSHRNITLAGLIIEPGNTDTNGDIITIRAPASPATHVVENILLLPNEDDAHAGQFLSLLGSANVTVTSIAHNTYPSTAASGESGAISYGETYAGHTGIISAIKSNLAWDHTAGGGYVFQRRNTSSVADGCSSGNITHNGKWNLSTGDYGVGYDDTAGTGMFSSGSPGASDVVVSADPFVDRTRRLSTWAVVRGYSVAGDYETRCADALVALQTNTATRLEDLMTFVKEGWGVDDPSLDGTAHDAGDIGAMPYAAASSATLKILLQFSDARLRKQSKHFDTYGVYALLP